MKLRLRVTSYKGRPTADGLEATFDHNGGTLGRSKEKAKNHFVLDDPEKFISRRHAVINFDKGIFYLTDTSVDGIYIINKNMHVSRKTVAVEDGDKLKIGDYELAVQIISDSELASPISPSSEVNPEVESIFDLKSENKAFDAVHHALPGSKADRGSLTEKGTFKTNTGENQLFEPTEDSPLHDSFVFPDLEGNKSSPNAIPESFDFQQLIAGLRPTPENADFSIPDEFESLSIDRSFLEQKSRQKESPCELPLAQSGIKQSQQQTVQSRPEQLPDNSIASDRNAAERIRQQAQLELLQAFLEGAGIKDTGVSCCDDTAEIMKAAGDIFRELVEGLISVLRGRAEVKAQFRVASTMLKAEDNNPLKFANNIDDALRQLLKGKVAGFVDAAKAVRDGYTDIKNHQLAMTAGIQAAIIKLIERFNPQHFAKLYQDGVVFQRKAKSWDAYQESFTEIADEALEGFFGESFVNAYEEQIQKLGSQNINK